MYSKSEIQRLRDTSDRLCREHHLSIIIHPHIIKLCTEHERRAFEEGIRWGVQLAGEIAYTIL